VIENWQGEAELSINGQPVEPGPDFRQGIEKTADEVASLVIWIRKQSTSPVSIVIKSAGPAGPACWNWPTQCHGDADNSGDVKGSDFLALKSSWFKCHPDGDYDPCADFDRDGCVKSSDFLVLKSNWFTSVASDCPPGGTWPPQP